MNRKQSEKGFTLVELLGVLVILSIIMVIAIPNTISVLDKNKKETYIADAKKLLSRAEYELLRDTSIEKPRSPLEISILYLSFLNNGDFEKDPEGYNYDEANSFVVVTLKNDTIEYYVQLKGAKQGDARKNRGIPLTSADSLIAEERLNYVMKDMGNLNKTEIARRISQLNGQAVATNIHEYR